MENVWRLACHDDRNESEIQDLAFEFSGRFWPDLQNALTMLQAKIHPTFYAQNRSDVRFFASGYRFDDFSFRILCFVLKPSGLKQLVFNNCALETRKIEVLARTLEGAKVSSLQVDWNPIEEPTQFALLAGPEIRVQSLSLKACVMENDGFGRICEALKQNTSVKQLDLYGNNISDLKKLAEMLGVNRTLGGISLCCNRIGDQELEPLVGAVGKIRLNAEEAEDYKREEREKAKSKVFNMKKERFSEILSDELITDDSTGEFYVLKNQVFRQLNLSLNQISNDHFLRLFLSTAHKHFQVLLTGNPFSATTVSSLTQVFPINVII
jgi:hypothetical protein